jgi:4-diphosphocytidyl-2-C-methyl-D-erythritol kinase
LLTLKAPAKINWFLYVVGKRSDGYHDIVTFLQSVSLYDELIFEPDTCNKPYGTVEIIDDMNLSKEKNLVFKAIMALKEYTGHEGGVCVTLRKSIPIEAGLGGGSSDAASTLLALNRLWGYNLPTDELARIGGRVGSDVPFFVYSACSLVKGRGEVVTPLDICVEIPLVIVKPTFSISTPWAYRQIRDYSHSLSDFTETVSGFTAALRSKDFITAAAYVKNDIENAIAQEFPEVGEIEKTLALEGAWVSLLSGSGSAVFGAFSSSDEAARASERISMQMPGYKCQAVHTLIAQPVLF